jgi:hypothetical protein
MIKEIKTVKEYYEMEDDKDVDLKVVKICTSWQEECKLYKQIFEKISEEYKNFQKLVFMK